MGVATMAMSTIRNEVGQFIGLLLSQLLSIATLCVL